LAGTIDSEFREPLLLRCAGETGTDTSVWIRHTCLPKGIRPARSLRALFQWCSWL